MKSKWLASRKQIFSLRRTPASIEPRASCNKARRDFKVLRASWIDSAPGCGFSPSDFSTRSTRSRAKRGIARRNASWKSNLDVISSFSSHDGTKFGSDQRQTERKKSGLRVGRAGGQNSIGNSVGVCERNQVQQKSIAQRPQRRELGLVAKTSIGDSVGVWARNQSKRGKHRTEVTEATEGELGLVVKTSIGDSVGVWARNQVQGGKHRTEVTEGELGLVVKTSYRRQRGRLGEKLSPRGKHRTEKGEAPSPRSPSNERRPATHARRVISLSRHRR